MGRRSRPRHRGEVAQCARASGAFSRRFSAGSVTWAGCSVNSHGSTRAIECHGPAIKSDGPMKFAGWGAFSARFALGTSVALRAGDEATPSPVRGVPRARRSAVRMQRALRAEGGDFRRPPRLLRQRHARACDRGARAGLVRRGARRRRHARAAHLQRGARGGGGAVLGGARPHLHRAEPGHQRLRAVERPGGPHHRRRDVGRGGARGAAARITQPADLGRQEARDPAARQHAGRGVARVAEGAGLSDEPRGRRRRRHPAAGERADARRRFARARSTVPGCRSRGPRASSSRAAAWCWWTSAASGRTGSS